AALMMEKFFLANILQKIPRVFSHLYVLLMLLLSWVIFSVDGLPQAFAYLKGMFGGLPATNEISLYYLKSYIVVIILAGFLATPVLSSLCEKTLTSPKFGKAANILEPVFYAALLLLSTAYIVDSTFNPFLYFRF
ncbi:MAG: MBOAT family protein, partial [Clostridiales bacterium]|nr:MBOAT family protein [Clostridiales bacterium]